MNIYVFYGFLAFLCIIIQIFEEEQYFYVFDALLCVSYVKAVGFTNLFLLQYRAPPELTEF